MTSRTCLDCPAPIGDRNVTGRCRACSMRVTCLQARADGRNVGHPSRHSVEKIERVRRLVDTYGIEDAAAVAKIPIAAVRRMQRRGWTRGAGGPPQRPRPSDFALLADTMSIEALTRHYRTNRCLVRKWAGEVGRQSWRGQNQPRISLPDDFLERVERAGIPSAAAEMGISKDTLRKRVREATQARVGTSAGWVDRYARQAFGAPA